MDTRPCFIKTRRPDTIGGGQQHRHELLLGFLPSLFAHDIVSPMQEKKKQNDKRVEFTKVWIELNIQVPTYVECTPLSTNGVFKLTKKFFYIEALVAWALSWTGVRGDCNASRVPATDQLPCHPAHSDPINALALPDFVLFFWSKEERLARPTSAAFTYLIATGYTLCLPSRRSLRILQKKAVLNI